MMPELVRPPTESDYGVDQIREVTAWPVARIAAEIAKREFPAPDFHWGKAPRWHEKTVAHGLGVSIAELARRRAYSKKANPDGTTAPELWCDKLLKEFKNE